MRNDAPRNDPWILVVWYIDEDNTITDHYQEDCDSDAACMLRVREIQADGLFQDTTEATEQDFERLIERRGHPRDASEQPPYNPTFDWIPPHRIVKAHWFQTWPDAT